MNNLKQKDKEVREILQLYNRDVFLTVKLREQGGRIATKDIIEYALSMLDGDQRMIIEKEYLVKSPEDWWQAYYSKSTYYRIKNQALDVFLENLKW